MDDTSLIDSIGRSRIVSWLRDRIIRPAHIENAESSGYLLTTDTGPDGSLTTQWQSTADLELVSDGDLDVELAEKADRIHRHQGVEIDNVPSGSVAATNVQDAIIELDTEKLSTTDAASTYLKLDASNDPLTGALTIMPTAEAAILDVNGQIGTNSNTIVKIHAKSSYSPELWWSSGGTLRWTLSGVNNLVLRDSVASTDVFDAGTSGNFDIYPDEPSYTGRGKVAGQTIWHDGNAFSRVKVITEPDILMAQSMALEAQKEAVDLDALQERKIDFELDQKADILHLHDDRYTNSARFMAGMYAANSGAPTHTSSGGYQKVGSGGGTLTWTSEFDVRPDGYSAQVDTATNKRIDIRYPGLYQISWGGAFSAITDEKIMDWSVYKNGSQLFGMGLTTGVAGTPPVKVSRIASLAAGDYLELYAYQNDSVSEAYYTPSQYSPYIQAIYLGPSTRF